jgi:hypothetical protein
MKGDITEHLLVPKAPFVCGCQATQTAELHFFLLKKTQNEENGSQLDNTAALALGALAER